MAADCISNKLILDNAFAIKVPIRLCWAGISCGQHTLCLQDHTEFFTYTVWVCARTAYDVDMPWLLLVSVSELIPLYDMYDYDVCELKVFRKPIPSVY